MMPSCSEILFMRSANGSSLISTLLPTGPDLRSLPVDSIVWQPLRLRGGRNQVPGPRYLAGTLPAIPLGWSGSR